MPSYDRCAQEFVAAFPDVDFDKALYLAIEKRSIHIVQFLHERLHWYSLLLCFLLVEPNMGDLWIGIGAPGYGLRVLALARPRNKVFWMTMRASASAMWVICTVSRYRQRLTPFCSTIISFSVP